MDSLPHNIIIVGAGIAGIASALALSRELAPFVPNLTITIYERHEILSTSGGAINLTPVAQRHLAQLGVLEELDRMGPEGGAEVDAIEFYSMRSGRSVGSIDFVNQAGNGFGGYKGRRVMRIMLSIAMITVVERTRNIDIVYGEKSSISFLQTTIPSQTISSPIHFRSSAMNYSRHGSILTTYCDRNREQIFAAAIVQFSQEDLSYHKLEPTQDWATQDRIRSALRRQMQDRFSKTSIRCIREMVASKADWMLYPVYQVRPGGRWCLNRVILLGDAAHAMPPRDESAAYALDDAILFARLLARYRSEPLSEVFDAYEGLRRDKINHAFKESGRMWDRNRDMGMLESRLKEWMMPLYLRSHRDEREAAWEFDAAQITLPTPAPSDDLLILIHGLIMVGTFSSVPAVDFARLTDPRTKSDELAKLKEAIFVVGFLYLTNTGLENLIHRTHEALPRLFNLPTGVKENCNMIHSPSFLGYTRLGAETTASKTDLREQFDFGTPGVKEWVKGDPFWQRLEGPNQYPDQPGSQRLVEDYICQIDSLAQGFMHLVAECLTLPTDTFDDFKGNMSRLKFVKYPPSTANSQGVGPHKDSAGLFTFLSQDNTGGLQVLNKDGEWIDVPPVEGSLVINIQQGFEAITGGICAATTHRVIAPTSKTRYSIPFFLGVRLDLTLDQLNESAAHIVRRIPVSDDQKKRAVDVPSEFLSPLYSCFGEAHLRNRILSHPDVGQQWYPELYAKYSRQSLE
ncbi:hypothetical protein N7513_010706 [Penicillium frequentans]|nr:hypothetical protein N7513_010706 [Penicillium glabrum]